MEQRGVLCSTCVIFNMTLTLTVYASLPSVQVARGSIHLRVRQYEGTVRPKQRDHTIDENTCGQISRGNVGYEDWSPRANPLYLSKLKSVHRKGSAITAATRGTHEPHRKAEASRGVRESRRLNHHPPAYLSCGCLPVPAYAARCPLRPPPPPSAI